MIFLVNIPRSQVLVISGCNSFIFPSISWRWIIKMELQFRGKSNLWTVQSSSLWLMITVSEGKWLIMIMMMETWFLWFSTITCTLVCQNKTERTLFVSLHLRIMKLCFFNLLILMIYINAGSALSCSRTLWPVVRECSQYAGSGMAHSGRRSTAGPGTQPRKNISFSSSSSEWNNTDLPQWPTAPFTKRDNAEWYTPTHDSWTLAELPSVKNCGNIDRSDTMSCEVMLSNESSSQWQETRVWTFLRIKLNVMYTLWLDRKTSQ